MAISPDGSRQASEEAAPGETAARVSPAAAPSEPPHGDELAEAQSATSGLREQRAASATADDLPVAEGDMPTAGAEPEDLTAKAEEYLELAKRTKADFENFRRRAARDAALAQERGVAKLARELLPAIDNLERALAHAPQTGEQDVTAFVGGVEHVHADLLAALQRAGIERYSPEGEPFDPNLHEAIAKQPVEGAAPDTVAEVYQRGYRIGETVLRPARVVVAG